MIEATAIRTAIDELLKGTIGKVRTVIASTVKSGYQPWHGQVLVGPTYDIKIDNLAQHSASPVSAIASYRLDNLAVTIDLFHCLKSPVVEAERNAVRELVISHADTIAQALHYPNNLRATSAGALTGIVSGLLDKLSWSIVDEDWTAEPARIKSQIKGTAIVRITQPTPSLIHDGNMEETGVTYWLAGSYSLIEKDTVNPQYGLQCLKITTLPGGYGSYTYQDVLVVGESYHLIGYARSNGESIPFVKIQDGENIWIGSLETIWQSFDVTFVATHTRLVFAILGTGGWYDSISLTR